MIEIFPNNIQFNILKHINDTTFVSMKLNRIHRNILVKEERNRLMMKLHNKNLITKHTIDEMKTNLIFCSAKEFHFQKYEDVLDNIMKFNPMPKTPSGLIYKFCPYYLTQILVQENAKTIIDTLHYIIYQIEHNYTTGSPNNNFIKRLYESQMDYSVKALKNRMIYDPEPFWIKIDNGLKKIKKSIEMPENPSEVSYLYFKAFRSQKKIQILIVCK